MTQTVRALAIAAAATGIALLAVFDAIPAGVAQVVPLAIVPFIVLSGRTCATRGA